MGMHSPRGKEATFFGELSPLVSRALSTQHPLAGVILAGLEYVQEAGQTSVNTESVQRYPHPVLMLACVTLGKSLSLFGPQLLTEKPWSMGRRPQSVGSPGF